MSDVPMPAFRSQAKQHPSSGRELFVSYQPPFLQDNRFECSQTCPVLTTGMMRRSRRVMKGNLMRRRTTHASCFRSQAWARRSDFRFNIGFTAQEKLDLVAFLNSL